MARKIGTNLADRIAGTNLSDWLSGLGGNDTILGHGGNDQIHGGDGNDALYGGAGIDKIYGGNGADILAGGAGHDRINSGAGDDTVLGGDGDDLIIGGRDSLASRDSASRALVSVAICASCCRAACQSSHDMELCVPSGMRFSTSAETPSTAASAASTGRFAASATSSRAPMFHLIPHRFRVIHLPLYDRCAGRGRGGHGTCRAGSGHDAARSPPADQARGAASCAGTGVRRRWPPGWSRAGRGSRPPRPR